MVCFISRYSIILIFCDGDYVSVIYPGEWRCQCQDAEERESTQIPTVQTYLLSTDGISGIRLQGTTSQRGHATVHLC